MMRDTLSPFTDTSRDCAPYFRYWGKASQDSAAFHLAALHCLDVAAVAQAMLDRHAVLTDRFARLLHVDRDAARTLLPFVTTLHDLGKFDARFQAKVPALAAALNPAWAGVQGKGFDHGAWGFHHALRAERAVEPLIGKPARALLRAACGHHGAIPSQRAPVAPPLPPALAKADEDARQCWVADCAAQFRTRGAPLPWPGPEPSPVAAELFAGFVTVVDWLGSQEDFFPYRAEPIDLGSYFEATLLRAQRALEAAGFTPAQPSGAKFSSLFPDYEPRDVQQVTERLVLGDGPCMVVVEARMGSGKTEAALSLAERMLVQRVASGLFVGLPTMATANGLFARLVEVLPRMFSEPVNVRLAHGRSRANPLFRALTTARVVDRIDASQPEAAITCARWLLSRKRALLGQVGIGTVDQAMQAALFVRHHFVRTFGLANSVVVIDEVHAYDAYMSVIIARLLEWLGALGAPVILLSATLPAQRRATLLSAYARGARWPAIASSEEADATAPYPLVTVVSASGMTQHGGDSGGSIEVRIETLQLDEPEPSLRDRLIALARAGAMVAWVRNTVTEAQRAFEALRAHDVEVILFHARMRAVDRESVERVVLERFGKSGRRGGVILVGTQVVEQSLDLDFDLLVSDLAPIDLLLQRMGRLHRHPRPERPAPCREPTLVLVTPSDLAQQHLDFGRSGYVYDPVTLWLTGDVLRGVERVTLPGDIRPLVEAVYDDQQRTRRIGKAPTSKALSGAEDARRRDLEQRERRAQDVCIPPTTLDLGARPSVEDDDQQVEALTREGESTTVVLVQWDSSTRTASSIDGPRAWAASNGPLGGIDIEALLDETINVPSYRWEYIERGQQAEGSEGWARWSASFSRRLTDAGLRSLVAVPVQREGSVFMGRLKTSRRRRLVCYERSRGLWFEEAAPS